jgi:hypothetical protein
VGQRSLCRSPGCGGMVAARWLLASDGSGLFAAKSRHRTRHRCWLCQGDAAGAGVHSLASLHWRAWRLQVAAALHGPCCDSGAGVAVGWMTRNPLVVWNLRRAESGACSTTSCRRRRVVCRSPYACEAYFGNCTMVVRERIGGVFVRCGSLPVCIQMHCNSLIT